MFDSEQFVNNKYQSSDLQIIQRKISKQKIAAEHRTDQTNDHHMFESPHFRNPYSVSSEFDSSLRHSASSRLLHEDDDVILTSNDFNHQIFHQPNTRKVTKITPKENYSLSNSRPIKPRSTSASSGLPTKPSTLAQNDIQRLKNVRRHEPAHVSSDAASKKSLITPDSWKTHPVIIKKPTNKKPIPETVPKPVKTNEIPKPIIEQSSIPKKPRTEKPKHVSKPKTEPPKPIKQEKPKEEKEKLQKYIQEKRHEHEQNLSNEKQLKIIQEKERKEKLKKLNEQIKKVAQQPLPPALIKKSTSTQLQSKDQSEQTRERLLHLLGPRLTNEPPTEFHLNTPFEQHERSPSSSSSSSSSSDSIVEIQPPKLDHTLIHSRSEPPAQIAIEQRHQNILRWATNLTRDCNNIEDKFKYLRPDGTQPFDIIPSSHPNLQHNDGNLRLQIPLVIKNDNNIESKVIIPSKIVRPSGRLIKLNQNRTSEYQDQQLPGVGNLRDPSLERRIKRDRAAAKIQAVYRGYTVRKSIHWFNDKQQQLNSEFNKRPIHKSTKISSHSKDIFDTPALNLDMRLSDDNFTIGSTLLRHYQRNGTNFVSTPSVHIQSQQQQIQRPTSLPTYSDDYENITSTRSSTPIKQKQISEKPRIIQQTLHNTESTSSRTSSSSSSSKSSSSSSVTPTPTPPPPRPVHSNIQRRRSISPPLPQQISSDNGRPVHHHYPAPLPTTTTTSRRILDERRYSPDALERQLNAELHLLDGVEASMTQVENMERLRSVALAQQEVVSLAQILKNKPATDNLPQQQIQKFPASQRSSSTSSSSSSNTKHRSISPHSRHRTTQSATSSSSESILTARQKSARQKFHNETELQAYEKRLKDVEKKIRLLVKREDNIDNHQLKTIASEIFDEKQSISTSRAPPPSRPPRSSNESSISEDLPVSHKSSSSISTAIPQKTTNDTSEIRTETIENGNDLSYQQPSTIDTITTDVSDIERRIRTQQELLKTKKIEFEKLKQQQHKDALRRKEDELKKQLETYNQQIETLRIQPTSPKVVTPSRKSPLKKSSSSSSSSSGSSTPTKPQESSIAEDLPTTASQSKTDIVQEKRPIVKKERNFFDDDDDEEEEEDKQKPVGLKPLETPRDERDTQHDAQSLSIATDLGASSETDNDDSRRQSIDNEKSILNLNTNLPSPLKSKDDSESSSSTTTSEKSPKQQTFERKSSPIVNDYDEDFSDASHSRATPTKEPLIKTKIDDIDIESIQEDLEDKQSLHDTNQSLSSKSSADEQSEILVLVKKSASNTPRRQDDKTLEDELPLPSPRPPPSGFLPEVEQKVETNNNDDTSHDVSEDEEVNEQENKIDKLTDIFLRTFIDEAIDQGKQIERLKAESNKTTISLTKEAKEWVSEEDLTDEEYPKPIETEPNEFTIDLSGIGDKNVDEPRIESPRKAIIEEPVKPFVPHTREQVIQLCDEAIKILFNQNTDFSNRSAIQCQIPNSYFTINQQDLDDENIQRNHHAYCLMIFNLCIELLHEMYSENVQLAKYPQWQKAKLISKRFYRGKKPENHQEIEEIIHKKILEILNLNSRQITYSKWRVSNNRRPGIEKFEIVLDEEIRRTESQWINYDDDCIQMKFDIADSIFDQIIQETLNESFNIVDKRFYLSSNSTRL